jgi:hypothetical protein
MSDYDDLIAGNGVGSVISAARGKNESQNSGNHDFTPDDLKLVNMGIKVPAYIRDEWMIAARRKKTKIATIIRAALIAELGVPEGAADLLEKE